MRLLRQHPRVVVVSAVVVVLACRNGRRLLEFQAPDVIGIIHARNSSFSIYHIFVVAERDGAAGVPFAFEAAVADGTQGFQALDGGDADEARAIADGDGTALALSFIAALSTADARRVVAAQGRNGATRDADVAALGILACADARRIAATRGVDGAGAADADVAARVGSVAAIGAADARCVSAARGRDVGRAVDGDAAARGVAAATGITAADARAAVAVSRGRHGGAGDGDAAARGVLPAADARRQIAAVGHHGAAFYHDVAAGHAATAGRAIAATNGRAGAVARCGELVGAAALDGEGIFSAALRGIVGGKDGGIAAVEVFHRVLALHDDRGVAEAGYPSPKAFILSVILTVDGGAVERYRRAGGYLHLHLLRLAVERARETITVG